MGTGRRALLAVFVGVVTAAALNVQTAVAQSVEQAEAFNEAWRQHTDARAGNDIALKVDTAREVLDIGKTFMAEDDERLAMLMHNYGTVLLQSGQYDEARAVLVDALELMENVHGKQSLELVETIKAAADAWGGHPDYAERHHAGYKRALRIVARHFGKDSLEYADLLMETGARVYDLSRSDVAEYRLRKALEIYEARLQVPDVRIGAAAFYLGKMRIGKGNYDKAIAYLDTALPNFEGDTDAERENRLRTMSLLVYAHSEKRQFDRVDEYADRIGRELQSGPNANITPLITVNPAYPEEFYKRGIEGYVDVEISIDHEGRVFNPTVVDVNHSYSSHADSMGPVPRPGDIPGAKYESFEEAALEAVSRYRFAPRYVDNKPVIVYGHLVRIEFDRRR